MTINIVNATHFKILREADFIRSERKGIDMHNTTRCAEHGERMLSLLLPKFGHAKVILLLAEDAEDGEFAASFSFLFRPSGRRTSRLEPYRF